MQLSPAISVGSPASEFSKVYSGALFRLPGITTFSYSSHHPSDITLKLATREHVAIANAVLRDVVDGVRLLATTRDTSTGPIADWARATNNMVSAVAAMPGVYRAQYVGSAEDPIVRFLTIDAAAATLLARLVEPRLGVHRVVFSPR